MICMFVCGVARVVFFTACLMVAILRPDAASTAVVPFAFAVWALALYDAWDRRRWTRRVPR